MKADDRRKGIADLLLASEEPISGGELSARFGVSRQIIVHDISLLKAKGFDILATHSGYILQASPLIEEEFKILHSTEATEQELNLIVDLGGTVVDVFVWHKVYGRVSAKLNINTRKQVTEFMENVRSGKSVELMNITGGYHYHTIRTETAEEMERIRAALDAGGFLVAED